MQMNTVCTQNKNKENLFPPLLTHCISHTLIMGGVQWARPSGRNRQTASVPDHHQWAACEMWEPPKQTHNCKSSWRLQSAMNVKASSLTKKN